MKSFQDLRDAATDPPTPPKQIHRAPTAHAAKHSRRNSMQITNAQKSAPAPAKMPAVLIDVPAIRNPRKSLKTNNRPLF
jgi:hypothetical protein